MGKINEKAKSFIDFATKTSQNRISLMQKTKDVVLELDKLGLEVSFIKIKEKPAKVVLSVGKYNLVIQTTRKNKGSYIYLGYDFDTKSNFISTPSFEEFKNKLSKIRL
jgi:hypothetical protein